MIKPPNLTTAQFEESVQKLRERSLLEILLYHSLIDELEEHLITNKEPYLLKTIEELKEYPELLYFLSLEALLPDGCEVRCYFHLNNVEVEPNSKHRKLTVEDYMHKNIQLTLEYIRDNK